MASFQLQLVEPEVASLPRASLPPRLLLPARLPPCAACAACGRLRGRLLDGRSSLLGNRDLQFRRVLGAPARENLASSPMANPSPASGLLFPRRREIVRLLTLVRSNENRRASGLRRARDCRKCSHAAPLASSAAHRCSRTSPRRRRPMLKRSSGLAVARGSSARS